MENAHLSKSEWPLDKKSKKAILKSIQIWKRLGFFFDEVVSSSLLVARQTANLIRKKCLVKTKPNIRPEFTNEDIKDILSTLLAENRDKTVAVVSDPDILARFIKIFHGEIGGDIFFTNGSLAAFRIDSFHPLKTTMMTLIHGV